MLSLKWLQTTSIMCLSKFSLNKTCITVNSFLLKSCEHVWLTDLNSKKKIKTCIFRMATEYHTSKEKCKIGLLLLQH